VKQSKYFDFVVLLEAFVFGVKDGRSGLFHFLAHLGLLFFKFLAALEVSLIFFCVVNLRLAVEL
jgi:Kef-type K+ transport system membrane component KefB